VRVYAAKVRQRAKSTARTFNHPDPPRSTMIKATAAAHR
jgi:hypothetical protein